MTNFSALPDACVSHPHATQTRRPPMSMWSVLAMAVMAYSPVQSMAESVPSSMSATLVGMPSQQVPAYYHVPLGQFTVTVVNDGFNRLGTDLFAAKPQRIEQLLQRQHIDSTGGIETAVNTFLVNTGTELVLIDTGMGACGSPATGHLLKNLAASGYQASQINKVLITHFHGDHICGLVDKDNNKTFPNAVVYVAQDEADFWLNDANLAKIPKDQQAKRKGTFDTAQRVLKPYQDSQMLKIFGPKDMIADGIKAMPTHGHTAGHSSYVVQSGGAQMIVLGDLIHNHAVQFAEPSIAIAYDSTPAQAIKTRQQVFGDAAKAGRLIAGAHLPFPAVGYLAQDGQHYNWYRLNFSPLTPAPSNAKTPAAGSTKD